MFHPFIGIVIQVNKQRIPSFGQCFIVDGESVVLGCNVGFVLAYLKYRLVMAAVSVFQFVSVGASGKGHQMVAQANYIDGSIRVECVGKGLDSQIALLWITGSV